MLFGETYNALFLPLTMCCLSSRTGEPSLVFKL